AEEADPRFRIRMIADRQRDDRFLLQIEFAFGVAVLLKIHVEVGKKRRNATVNQKRLGQRVGAEHFTKTTVGLSDFLGSQSFRDRFQARHGSIPPSSEIGGSFSSLIVRSSKRV